MHAWVTSDCSCRCTSTWADGRHSVGCTSLQRSALGPSGGPSTTSLVRRSSRFHTLRGTMSQGVKHGDCMMAVNIAANRLYLK